MLLLNTPSLLALTFALTLLSSAFAIPTNNVPHISISTKYTMSRRVDGDSDTAMEDADETIPPPSSGPTYAEWMKNLYDMGGKTRRDNLDQYKTSISEEEIDAWRLAREGPNGYGRYIGG